MALLGILSEPTALRDRPAVGRTRLRVTDLLLPAAVGLWALGVSQTQLTMLLPWGLLTDLPVVFYAGIALLVVSAAIELARPRPSGWRLAAHAVALVVMLYGTAPIIYSQGRYAWLYKTVGVVQYVNAHGQLNRYIDIYQNWPGFFALAAWFGKVAGVATPLAYAKWAQLVFELAALPLLYLAYDALSLTVRQRWVALLLYPAANWIGQDYLSPQALGTLLGLGVMAMALRWLFVGNPSAYRWNNQAADAGPVDQPRRQSRVRPGPPAVICGLLMVYFVLTFTHELSPYILAIQLGALAAVRLLQPRWLPAVLGAIAVGYLLPRFAFVNARYGLVASVGNFFGNVQPPAHNTIALQASQRLIEHMAEALSVGMWCLAALGAWLRRRSGPAISALSLLAFSPIVVLAVGGYGSEGILRVYLFSLPWSAALAASALAPASARTSKGGGHGMPAGIGVLPRRMVRRFATAVRLPAGRLSPGTFRIPIALAVTLGLFLPAFFGNDSFNRMPQTEVASVTSFLQSASPGPLFCAIDNAAPVADTARYNLFPLIAIYGSGGVAGTVSASPGIANALAAESMRYTHGREPAYVLVTPTMVAYAQAYGVPLVQGFTVLLRSLADSPRWKLLVDRAGTVIYELPPTPGHR